ncbi:MAG TPA: class I SAM-dependent methyltransferase [Candidatus Elarobacter sp.]|jgi:SAM-dependent methyltransferase|nr:class I SAM-dependent methyltransferase [Candidatus Elarobacter sp.]
MLKIAIPADDPRSEARIRAHYEVERELAQRLRDASKPERRVLYTQLYDALYRELPDHPQLTNASLSERSAEIARIVSRLAPFLSSTSVFLEIGPGDCGLSFALARRCAYVHAVDVSDGVCDVAAQPPNFALHLSDGTSIPLPDESVDLAFSDQLMEHLHPDDARDQLREIRRVLRPGGIYVCITPNRLSGPHDVSRFFSDVAQGFHIREYTARELGALMREIGFRRVDAAVPVRGRLVRAPLAPFAALETALAALPAAAQRALGRSAALRGVLGIRVIAAK